MIQKKRVHAKIKAGLHPRNKHRERYNFKKLVGSCPALAPFVQLNDYQDESIDFSNPEAVKMLNTALLKHHYDLDWDIPKKYLCPPIPGRADYIHYMADLLGQNTGGKVGIARQIKCLDIGVGANCVYPMIGVKEYGWSFIGTDIDASALEAAHKIIALNPFLKGKIELRLQKNPNNIFNGIIEKGELIDLSICNPPFHASLAEAQSGTSRKVKNLNPKKDTKLTLNFGGKSHELWCKGGEKRFVLNMVRQSKQFAQSCRWFSTLISKKSNLKVVYDAIKIVEATDIKTIPMEQGNKVSRIVAWTFLSKEQQKKMNK